MKKIIMTVLGIVMVTMCYAKKPLQITSGDATFLKQKANAIVEFDYSHTTWEEDQTYKAYCAEENDYDKRVQLSIDAFIQSFNNSSKALQINEDRPKYKMVVVVDDMERRQGNGWWGSMYIRIFGHIEVTDLDTQTPVARIEMTKIIGDTDFVEYDRLSKCFAELATQLLKFK